MVHDMNCARTTMLSACGCNNMQPCPRRCCRHHAWWILSRMSMLAPGKTRDLQQARGTPAAPALSNGLDTATSLTQTCRIQCVTHVHGLCAACVLCMCPWVSWSEYHIKAPQPCILHALYTCMTDNSTYASVSALGSADCVYHPSLRPACCCASAIAGGTYDSLHT